MSAASQRSTVPGDPVYVLCKEGPPNGRQDRASRHGFFIRRPGETARSNKQEMDLLLDRRNAALGKVTLADGEWEISQPIR